MKQQISILDRSLPIVVTLGGVDSIHSLAGLQVCGVRLNRIQANEQGEYGREDTKSRNPISNLINVASRRSHVSVPLCRMLDLVQASLCSWYGHSRQDKDQGSR
jgi:hypothetical protein